MQSTQARPRNALVIGLPLIHQRSIRQALVGEGFGQVFHAGDGVQAAAILSSELVDIVFTPESGRDYRLADVFRMMQGRGPNRRAPVVLLDEGVPRPLIVSAIKAGAAGVLPIPTDRRALLQLLGRIDGPGVAVDGIRRAESDIREPG